MKKLRKILPAFAMLMLAACLLSTSSFAWFSMNSRVTATGMSVTAEAAGSSLLISNDNISFGSTTTLANDTKDAETDFVPVTYDNTFGWYQLTAAGKLDVNGVGQLSTDNQVADGSPAASFADKSGIYAEANAYVYHDRVWLKLEGGNADKGVVATVEYADTTTDLDIKKAMHVLFVVNNTVVATVDMGADTTTTPTLLTLTPGVASQIDIYYFLSGHDAECMNRNITQTATMNADITFAAN